MSKSVVLYSVFLVAVSWRGVGMDAEVDEEEFAGAIATGAAVVRWPPEQEVCRAVTPCEQLLRGK